jgi:hypothetical protein
MAKDRWVAPNGPSIACSSSTLAGDYRTSAPGAYLPAVSNSGTPANRRTARGPPNRRDGQAIAASYWIIRDFVRTRVKRRPSSILVIRLFHRAIATHKARCVVEYLDAHFPPLHGPYASSFRLIEDFDVGNSGMLDCEKDKLNRTVVQAAKELPQDCRFLADAFVHDNPLDVSHDLIAFLPAATPRAAAALGQFHTAGPKQTLYHAALLVLLAAAGFGTGLPNGYARTEPRRARWGRAMPKDAGSGREGSASKGNAGGARQAREPHHRLAGAGGIANAAAQTRIVSGGKFCPSKWELSQHFK